MTPQSGTTLGNRYTLTIGSQGSHRLREILCGMVLKMPMEKMRVIFPGRSRITLSPVQLIRGARWV